MDSVQKKLTVTLRDLIAANAEVYERRKMPDGPQQALPAAEVIAYAFDPKSHHGGIAYYHEESGTLVMAHRGSATAKDWLVTDRQILFGKYETKADSAALAFSEKVLAELQASGRPVSNIIQTGHSKGGRESQMVLASQLHQGQVPAVGLTFNSARVDEDVRKGLVEVPHVNLRVDGGSFLSTDWVSSYGKQLGQQVNFPNPDINFFVSAHSLEAFVDGINRFPGLAELDVREVVQLCQQGLSVVEMNQYGLKSVQAMNQAIASAKEAAYVAPDQQTPPAYVAAHADALARKLNENDLIGVMRDQHHQTSVQLVALARDVSQHPLLQSHLHVLHSHAASPQDEKFRYAEESLQTVVASHVAIQDNLSDINERAQILIELQSKILQGIAADKLDHPMLVGLAQDVMDVRQSIAEIGMSPALKASIPLASNPHFGEQVLQRMQQNNISVTSHRAYSPG